MKEVASLVRILLEMWSFPWDERLQSVCSQSIITIAALCSNHKCAFVSPFYICSILSCYPERLRGTDGVDFSVIKAAPCLAIKKYFTHAMHLLNINDFIKEERSPSWHGRTYSF